MKTLVIANKEPHLNDSLQNCGQFEVLRAMTFIDGLLKVVQELRPQVVVFSPWLPGTQKIDPADVLFQISIMEPAPQVILLAGNFEKTDAFIMEAVSNGVYDIVFNPDEDSVLEEVMHQILDRVARPRSRAQVYSELGITQRKHVPVVSRERIEQRELNAQELYTEVEQETYPAVVATVPPVVINKKSTKPYVVGVISPASAGATFVASNVAATMAMEGFKTALIDFDSKRTLHHWFGRDTLNESFRHLFEYQEITDEDTSLRNLDAFTSASDEVYGDLEWLKTIEELTYEVVVLDFSSGQAWRKELLMQALKRCDEVQFVLDLDYAKTMQSRKLLEEISDAHQIPVRVVLNKFSPEYLACEISDLSPLPVGYEIPLCPDVYRAIVQGKPLVSLIPDLRYCFMLKEFRQRGLAV